MKAVTCRHYGAPDVLAIEEWPNPVPRAGEVTVDIDAFSVTTGDARIRAARAPAGMGPFIRLAFGLTKPRHVILGREYAGQITALGKGVTRFQVGDAVFGITDGMRLGAHAQAVAVKENGLILPRPNTLSAAEAAAFFFGGLTAADFLLDQCALTPGEHVLVVGATGAVGSAAVQIARHYGAQVTAVTSAANADLARELGADTVVDYRKETPVGSFDIILDVPGVLPNALTLLAPGGRLGLVTADLLQMVSAMMFPVRAGGQRIRAGVIKETPQALARLIELHSVGAYRPLVGDSLPFDEIVRAHTAADSGHKRGNVVVHAGT
jgi:NADPH:quinone reductase-like Zn-dependent oxidoreductase